MTKAFHAEPTGNTVNMNCRIRQNKDQPDLYPSSEYQVRWYWKQSISCCSEDTKPPNVSGKNHDIVFYCNYINPKRLAFFIFEFIQISKMRKMKRSILQILEYFWIQIQQKSQLIKSLEYGRIHTDRKYC